MQHSLQRVLPCVVTFYLNGQLFVLAACEHQKHLILLTAVHLYRG